MDKLLDRYEYSEERSRKVLEEHVALVELLKTGELRKAQMAMESHTVRPSTPSARLMTGRSIMVNRLSSYCFHKFATVYLSILLVLRSELIRHKDSVFYTGVRGL